MFDLLDDPNPTQPTDARRVTIVTASHRRRRRMARSIVATCAVGLIAATAGWVMLDSTARHGTITVAAAPTSATTATTAAPSLDTPEDILERIIPDLEALGFPVDDDAIAEAVRAQDEQMREIMEYLRRDLPEDSFDPGHANDARSLTIVAGERLTSVLGRPVPDDPGWDVRSLAVQAWVSGRSDTGAQSQFPIPMLWPGSEAVAEFAPDCELWERDHRSSTDLLLIASCPEGVVTFSLVSPEAQETFTHDEVIRLARLGLDLPPASTSDHGAG